MGSKWPKSWRRARLGDIADVNWGDTSITKKSYASKGYPAYSATGPDGFLPYADYDRVGVVVSAIGANCGKTWLAKGKWSCIKNTIRFFSITDEVDTEFLYWLTKDPSFWPKRGSAQPFISQADARNVEIAYPPLPEQRAIARILGVLDDKIELNRRMNETLEAMAQALFKSWFVDFDPVVVNALRAGNPIPEKFAERAAWYGRGMPRPDNALGLPEHILRLFPARFVDSELGPIPEGWEVKALDEIAQFQNGLALQKYRPKPSEAKLPVVKIAQLRSGRADGNEWASANIRPDCIIDDGDVVFSWSGSLLLKIWCGGRAALNQHLFKVTSREYPKWLYYHWIDEHLAEFIHIASGKATTMGHIKRHHLSDAKCVVAEQALMAKVHPHFESLLIRRIENELESRTLADLRDTLLPKLISGELRVPDVEKILEDAL